jgi:hypothetical protein
MSRQLPILSHWAQGKWHPYGVTPTAQLASAERFNGMAMVGMWSSDRADLESLATQAKTNRLPFGIRLENPPADYLPDGRTLLPEHMTTAFFAKGGQYVADRIRGLDKIYPRASMPTWPHVIVNNELGIPPLPASGVWPWNTLHPAMLKPIRAALPGWGDLKIVAYNNWRRSPVSSTCYQGVSTAAQASADSLDSLASLWWTGEIGKPSGLRVITVGAGVIEGSPQETPLRRAANLGLMKNVVLAARPLDMVCWIQEATDPGTFYYENLCHVLGGLFVGDPDLAAQWAK